MTGGGLFAEIASFTNLWHAARCAARGKRTRPDVAAFLCGLEPWTLRLQAQLAGGSWQPGGYRTFRVRQPKERTICAAPFRDRVVHQALVQVVEPIFERGFVHDSYACRRGKGTHAAVQRVAAWARRYRWVARLDVSRYFPSLDHAVVLQRVARRVRCERTLDLFARILGSWRSQEAPLHWFPGDDLLAPAQRPRGLPIGNLVSQFLANVVLDRVDHAVKDDLGIRAYARYADDFVLLADNPDVLRAAMGRIRRELGALRLRPHPRKCHVFPVDQGIPWLGFAVYPDRIELRPAGLRRLRRQVAALAQRRARCPGAAPRVRASLAALRGFVHLSGIDWLGDRRVAAEPLRI